MAQVGVEAVLAYRERLSKLLPSWVREFRFGEEEKILSEIEPKLSEALEGYLDKSEKIPGFFAIEEELADAVLRIMGMAEHFRWDVAGAILAKMKYNAGRAHRHGGKKF